ncbi:hypothetical protein E2C01_082889 [Portunus trituberculatus]|uniref:Uncharacterized protein n=1 Tax=Portunus trituberculatus TaxID=210409 RepID=A0A5B7ITH2_PORTR|nr:hypothetical protein [Portunus trituberculatus]
MTAEGYAPEATHSSLVLRPSTSGSCGGLTTTLDGRTARTQDTMYTQNKQQQHGTVTQIKSLQTPTQQTNTTTSTSSSSSFSSSVTPHEGKRKEKKWDKVE